MNKHLIAYAALFIIILFLLNSVLMVKLPSMTADSTAPWKVYGTNGCGWTRKQLQVMDEKNISHSFVDCDQEDCAGMSAYPTLVDPSGNKTVGFKNF